MGNHKSTTAVRDMLRAAHGLLDRFSLEPELVPLKIKVQSIEKDLVHYLEQHQTEDEFRRIHDLPPTLKVNVPKGWTPQNGRVLKTKERDALLAGK